MQITEDQIREKAIEMFNVFSQAVNGVEDTYCTNFDYLQSKLKIGWINLAVYELEKNVKSNPS